MSHCFKNRGQNKTIQGPSRDSHGQESGVAAHPLWGMPFFSPCPTVSQNLAASLTLIIVAVVPGGGLPAYSEATVHSLTWGLSKFRSLTEQQSTFPLLTCGGSLSFPLLVGGRLSFLRGEEAPLWGGGSFLGQEAFVLMSLYWSSCSCFLSFFLSIHHLPSTTYLLSPLLSRWWIQIRPICI